MYSFAQAVILRSATPRDCAEAGTVTPRLEGRRTRGSVTKRHDECCNTNPLRLDVGSKHNIYDIESTFDRAEDWKLDYMYLW